MRCLVPVLLSLTCISLLDAEEAEPSPMPTILTKSPFLPPDFQPPGTAGRATKEPVGAQQYEFRGVYELEGRLHFSLYDNKEKKARWITENNTGSSSIQILGYDPDKYSLELMIHGEPMSLTLIETSDKPMALAQAANKRTVPQPPRNSRSRRRVIRPTSRTQRPSTTNPQRRKVNPAPSKP